MIDDPGDPLGSDDLAIWSRKLMKFIRRHITVDIAGMKRKPMASGGVNWEPVLERIAGVAGVASGVTVKLFQVQSEQATTLTCSLPDGSINIQVLKPAWLQNIPRDSTEYGFTFATTPYSLPSNPNALSAGKRAFTLNFNTPDAITYVEAVNPPYGGAIWAVEIPVAFQTGNPPVQWLDLNVDARRWMKEVTVCTDTTGSPTKLALIDTTGAYPASQSIAGSI